MRRFGVLFVLAIGLEACGGGDPPDACLESPTFTNDIFPLIVETKCLMCHSRDLGEQNRMGAPPGVDFNTYDLVIARKKDFVDAITSGREPPPTLMPPIVLTAEERALVAKWADCEHPK